MSEVLATYLPEDAPLHELLAARRRDLEKAYWDGAFADNQQDVRDLIRLVIDDLSIASLQVVPRPRLVTLKPTLCVYDCRGMGRVGAT